MVQIRRPAFGTSCKASGNAAAVNGISVLVASLLVVVCSGVAANAADRPAGRLDAAAGAQADGQAPLAEPEAAAVIPNAEKSLQAQPAVAPEIGERIVELLRQGFGSRKIRLESVESRYRELEQIAADEPRVHLAWALVLWKRGRAKLVEPQLSAACDASETVYFPAWETAIWFHLRPETTDEAIERILEVSRRIAAAPEQITGVASAEAAVTWLGRVTAASEFLATRETDVARWAAADQQLRALFPPDLAESYRVAHEDTLVLAEQLSNNATAQTERARTEQEVLADQTRRQVSDQQTDLQLARNKVEADREALSRDLQARMQQAADKLDQLELQYGTLQATAARHEAASVELELQIAQLTGQRLPPTDNRAAAFNLRLDRLIQQLMARAQQLRLEAWGCVQQQLRVSRQAQALVQQRDQMLRSYEQQFGKLEDAHRELQDWGQRLIKLDTAASKIITGTNRETRAARTKAKSLVTYVGFDLDDIRQQLLAECSPESAPAEDDELLAPLLPPAPAP